MCVMYVDVCNVITCSFLDDNCNNCKRRVKRLNFTKFCQRDYGTFQFSNEKLSALMLSVCVSEFIVQFVC